MVQNGVQNFFRGSGSDVGVQGRDIVHTAPPPFQPWISNEPKLQAIEGVTSAAQPAIVEPDVVCMTRSFEDRNPVFVPQRFAEPPGFQPIRKITEKRSMAKGAINESELERFYCDRKHFVPEM